MIQRLQMLSFYVHYHPRLFSQYLQLSQSEILMEFEVLNKRSQLIKTFSQRDLMFDF